MENLTLRIARAVCVLAVLGFASTLACQPDRITACQNHLSGYTAASEPTPEFCRAVEDVLACFKRETSSCPAVMQSTLEVALKAMEDSAKLCHGSMNGGTSDIDLGDVESCDHVAFQKCADEFQKAATSASSAQEGCRTLGDARKCMEDFKRGCKSDYLIKLVDTQMGMIEQQEHACRASGLSVGDGSSSSSSGGSTVDVGDVSSCDQKEFQRCANDFKKAALKSSSAREGCQMLGDARKCMEDFKSGCNSEFLVSLVDNQMEMIAEQEMNCKNRGYSVGGSSNGGSSNGGSPSSSGGKESSDGDTCNPASFSECIESFKATSPQDACRNLGRVRQCLNEYSSQCKGGAYQSNIATEAAQLDKIGEECKKEGYETGDPEGGSGSLRPTFVTLLASCVAIMAVFRRFL